MALAWCAVRRSASKFGSLCGGRVRINSTVVDRPSLALNPSPLRPFVSSSFYYPAVVDQLSSEKMLIREIDSEINLASQISDMFKDATPGSLPFRIEDDGGKTVTLTRDYKGEHIKVVVGMPCESRDDKSGLSLKFCCKVIDGHIDIYDVFVDHSGDELPNIEWSSDDFKDVNHNVENALYKYLETRLTKGTTNFLYEYMTTNKRRHLFWLKDVKKFLDDES
ncbi:PREDICTED: uncharacterized protein At2g39795, mitochondrial-like [Camelina sativa]|uniref:Uncharacterized protein At2g39795, mitochondrial-like n=1 Tax=Camelina sativa TaxID=90675 RepID=A0ABM0ZAY0_CAMSA|nr:PREDICTED: uncharacterized protein At2g39795, mitochondrial-like [Camelina sativa]